MIRSERQHPSYHATIRLEKCNELQIFAWKSVTKLVYSFGKVYFKDKLPNVIIPDIDLSDLEG